MTIALLPALLLAAAPGAAGAPDFNPSAVQVEDVVACRLDARQFNGFVAWATGPDNGGASRGWARVDGDEPTIVEFRLPAPIAAFGRTTDRIGFAGTAVLAMLPEVAPATIAGEVGIANTIPDDTRFFGEKLVDRRVEHDADLGMSYTYKRVMIVTAFPSHPGATFAGCSYRAEEGDR